MNVNLEKSVHHEVIMTIVKTPIHEMLAWASEVAKKLINDELTIGWMEEQKICAALSSECGVKIASVLNFPTDKPTVDEVYPLAFLLKAKEIATTAETDC